MENNTLNRDLRVLDESELEAVSGGFVCGGLCVAGAFAAGALIGGGATWLVLRDP